MEFDNWKYLLSEAYNFCSNLFGSRNQEKEAFYRYLTEEKDFTENDLYRVVHILETDKAIRVFQSMIDYLLEVEAQDDIALETWRNLSAAGEAFWGQGVMDRSGGFFQTALSPIDLCPTHIPDDGENWEDFCDIEENPFVESVDPLSQEAASTNLSPQEIAGLLRKRYRGNENIVQSISSLLYEHNLKQHHADHKRNTTVLLAGPTGNGKTFLAQQLADITDARLLSFNMSYFSPAGYEGASLSEIRNALAFQENQPGGLSGCILFLDEFDKIILPQMSSGGFNFRTPLHAELLSILDSYPVFCLCSGCFSFIRETKKPKKAIGFARDKSEDCGEPIIVTREDLLKRGAPQELVGRLDDILNIDPFSVEDYLDILRHAKGSALDDKRQFFRNEYGVELEVTPAALRYIAEEAYRSGYGARSLNQVIQNYFNKCCLLWHITSQTDKQITRITITSKSLRTNELPLCEFRDTKKKGGHIL